MPDDFISLWPAFVAAIGVGAATAAFVGADARRRSPARWLVWFCAASAAGVVAVALGAIQSEAALFIAIGVACFVAFLAGASAVAVARGGFGAHELWALGLVPLAALWLGTLALAPVKLASSFVPLGPASLEEQPTISPRDKADQTGAIPGAATSSNDPVALFAALPKGDLDAATCQRALDAVAAAEPVVFNATHATIHRRAASGLDRAVDVIRRCPQANVEVIGFDDGEGADAALALRRARAAERYLRAEGVGGRKLTVRAADARTTRPGQGVIGYALRDAPDEPARRDGR